MAIFHLSANVISRSRGQSIVAAAAYRAGVRLRDDRYGLVHDYVRRRTCAHAEIMAPADVPDWVHDRELLWNRVEGAEHRRDSQLARVIDIGLPVELTEEEALSLVRDYIASVFVARGMVADFCIRRDHPDTPHVHILLTLRGVTHAGFGPKERRWNGKANLLEWRAAWADRANQHLAHAGHAVRIDHRTLEAQQIELTPARRIGIGRTTADEDALPDHLVQRIAEQRLIARANGAAIVEDPTVALRALTHHSPVFTQRDLERFLRSRTEDDVQFEQALAAVMRCPERVVLPGAVQRFTSRDMIDAAKSLVRRVVSMAGRRGHEVTAHNRAAAAARLPPDARVVAGFDYLVSDGDAKAATVDAAARGALLDAALAAWGADALRVVRATPQTLGSLELLWREAREPLTATSVLLIERAEMIGLKQLERAIGVADRARAKVVLLGAATRPGSPAAGTPFWSVVQALGVEPQ